MDDRSSGLMASPYMLRFVEQSAACVNLLSLPGGLPARGTDVIATRFLTPLRDRAHFLDSILSF